MEPWFIATKPFGPDNGDVWDRYVAWSGLSQLRELVSLDEILCPTVLSDIPDRYWPHIVNEDFMLRYFRDLAFLQKELALLQKEPRDRTGHHVLCVFRDPPVHPASPPANFRFLGYDLVDIRDGASALSNCGGFPEIFLSSELSEHGLLTSYDKALRVRADLRERRSRDTDCHCWAIFRLES